MQTETAIFLLTNIQKKTSLYGNTKVWVYWREESDWLVLSHIFFLSNLQLGYSQPLRNPQRLKLGIDLEQDREKMEKVLINPLEITEAELLEE